MTKPSNIFRKLRLGWHLATTGHLEKVKNALIVRCYSHQKSIGLLRDLNDGFEIPKSKIEVSVREFQDSDINQLKENFRHIRLIKENIPTCYTAVTTDESPCYRQWFITSTQNARLQKHFGPIFPTLKNNEAIIEGVFTHPDYRGMIIMPYAMSQISEKYKEKGIQYVMAFVAADNKPSLKAFEKAGYKPYMIRESRWRFFKQHVTFKYLDDKKCFQNNLTLEAM